MMQGPPCTLAPILAQVIPREPGLRLTSRFAPQTPASRMGWAWQGQSECGQWALATVQCRTTQALGAASASPSTSPFVIHPARLGGPGMEGEAAAPDPAL